MKWEDFENKECWNCPFCYDSGGDLHFNVCEKTGVCVDCYPFNCLEDLFKVIK